MFKNTAGQKWICFAFQSEGGANPGNPVTGDAANITANLRLDGGAANAVDDTNPAELEDGYYFFTITQVESNADMILMAPASSTGNVIVIGVPGVVYTTTAMRGTDGVDTAAMRGTDSVDTAAMRGTDNAATETKQDIIDTVVDLIVADTNELQSDNVPGLIATLDAVVDTVKAETALIVADTNELQSDNVPGLIATLDAVVDTVKADTAAILTDTGTTLDDAIAVIDANVDDLKLGKIFGVAETGTLAIGSCTSDLTGFTDDQLIGRIIIFTSGPADGEATDITDYASASGLLTFTDLTLAPENGDTFFIV